MLMYPIVTPMAQADELPLLYAGTIDVRLTQGQLRVLVKALHVVHHVRPGKLSDMRVARPADLC